MAATGDGDGAGVSTRIACVQMEPRVGARDRNIERSVALLREAAAGGARLIVLPELCNSGYAFADRDEAAALAEEVPGGPACRAWGAVCSDLGVYVVAGICEREGDTIYNSSVVVGPEGHVGTFRKLHLWDRENLFFAPGDRGLPVFTLPFGRVATFICYDCWFPETFRRCATEGADIVCVPTNWVPLAGQRSDHPAMANLLCMANAHVNAMYVAAADRIGTERGQPFIGQSIIVDYHGWPVGGPAGTDGEEIIYADADIGAARRSRSWNAFNDPLRDRRRDVYGDLASPPAGSAPSSSTGR